MEVLSAFTANNAVGFLMIVFALMSILVLIGACIDAIQKITKPRAEKNKKTDARQVDIMAKCSENEQCINEHEERIARLEESMRVQCTALYALLEHELHNGNAEEMQAASRALFNHLNK